jgi:17beta-estradiol 17-dehydrogenase / very-long-chain 3-oxoacyl-CoA reductase
LLPKLRRTPGPVELVFTGSLSAQLACPRINPYGATKAFLRQLTGGLASDELFRATRAPNVSYLYMEVGSVASAGHVSAQSLGTPSSEDFARHFVKCIGCGRLYIVPYWPHALQLWSMSLIPESAKVAATLKAMESEVQAAKKA